MRGSYLLLGFWLISQKTSKYSMDINFLFKMFQPPNLSHYKVRLYSDVGGSSVMCASSQSYSESLLLSNISVEVCAYWSGRGPGNIYSGRMAIIQTRWLSGTHYSAVIILWGYFVAYYDKQSLSAITCPQRSECWKSLYSVIEHYLYTDSAPPIACWSVPICRITYPNCTSLIDSVATFFIFISSIDSSKL